MRLNKTESIAKLGHNPQAVVAYDNMNFKETKRDESIGNQSSIQCMTTSVIVLCPELPLSGLRQDMHNPTIPLRYKDIRFSSGLRGGHGLQSNISKAIIFNALKTVHGDTLSRVFEESICMQPEMPVMNRLQPRKTKFWQLGAIFEDEGTIAGTYKVHDSIFLEQLHLKTPAVSDQTINNFATRRWLVHGDQLTVQHNRSVRKEQSEATNAYNKQEWLHKLPA
jgi:hypothetical protein